MYGYAIATSYGILGEMSIFAKASLCSSLIFRRDARNIGVVDILYMIGCYHCYEIA